LFELANFAVITRPPVALASLADWLPRCIRNIVEPDQSGAFALYHRAGTWIRLVEIPALDISSSDIRIRMRDGESVRYLLPPDIEEAIEKSGAYLGIEKERCG
jgi:nicotinate-nucleotide adenylyltransferase